MHGRGHAPRPMWPAAWAGNHRVGHLPSHIPASSLRPAKNLPFITLTHRWADSTSANLIDTTPSGCRSKIIIFLISPNVLHSESRSLLRNQSGGMHNTRRDHIGSIPANPTFSPPSGRLSSHSPRAALTTRAQVAATKQTKKEAGGSHANVGQVCGILVEFFGVKHLLDHHHARRFFRHLLGLFVPAEPV